MSRRPPVERTVLPADAEHLTGEEELTPTMPTEPEALALVRARAIVTALVMLRDADPSERGELLADLRDHHEALGLAVDRALR